MPSVRDLRDRIRSLKNTQQITKAMKQVAGAKIRRAEALQAQSRPYAETLRSMLHELLSAVSVVHHPLMQAGREDAPHGVILLTADKGLAGAFNANLIRTADYYQRENPNVVWYTIGNKGRNAVRRFGQEIIHSWALTHVDKLANARECARMVGDDFVNGKVGKITIIAPKFVSMLSQKPTTHTLLPIAREDADDASVGGPTAEVEFEPGAEAVLSRLLPKYLEFTLYSAMLETDASFFAAQLVAMNNATDNAKKMIDTLTIVMNNARQAAITKEILEIVGGAEALAK